MGIKIIQFKGKFAPLIFCDHCNDKIEEGAKANYLWKTNLESGDTNGEIFFVHKKCNRIFEHLNSEEGHIWMWNSLGDLPVFLAHNLKIDWENQKEWIKAFDVF